MKNNNQISEIKIPYNIKIDLKKSPSVPDYTNSNQHTNRIKYNNSN